MKRAPINPAGLGVYPAMSQGFMSNGHIYVSGQVAFDGEGNVVGVGDALVQARQCFRNIELVLADAGAALTDVVRLTCYLVHRNDFADYSAVKLEIFPSDAPASSTILVAGLLDDRLLMEIEAIAIRV